MVMQLNRLFEIVYLLLERQNVTAAELAERFEVSTRTVYRDLDTLSGAGIPVYAAKGRGGGIRLLPGFVLDRSLLSEKEQDEILSSLQGMQATQAMPGGQVLSRLSGLFRRASVEWVDVDFSPWGSGEAEREGFGLLKAGILESYVTRFDYYGANGEKSTRCVEPMMLRFKDRHWYLQAYCLQRREYRTFRISRMENICLTQERFARREGPPPLDQMALATHRALALELCFSLEAAYRVFDEFSRDEIHQNSDGSLTVHAHCLDDSWIYGFLLSFGDDVTVISPACVRETMCAMAERIRRLYSPTE